ncbi:uncharacterized protein DUF3576 [Palleronia aestuarii]|uniref:Uncharacterized protein DUF3576 n=1 Tax=Palleronia aestuarii TaxID=568105 RepID=A0A2W7P621_9RHOB|nr:DUF3576 domain-containing protein [Palleronia aestuarii]PZX18852.1 uncharacterized protein DUF3576 [Palleronia aestuarii]
MRRFPGFRLAGPMLLIALTSACSSGAPSSSAGPSDAVLRQRANTPLGVQDERSTIWDLFGGAEDQNRTVAVNKYIWAAAQDVLDFMPIKTADPFSGVIVYGYGRPPGGGQAYRATVYVQDPALDARSLNVALATAAGPVGTDTARAIEDAILTRARQLRLADARL